MTTTHANPEEVMAWVDGELAEGEARIVAAHVGECVQCADVAEGFRRMSQELAGWNVEEVPEWVGREVLREAEGGGGESHIAKLRYGGPSGKKIHPHGRLRRAWGARGWVIGISSVAALVLLLVVGPMFHQPVVRHMEMAAPSGPQPAPAPVADMAAPAPPVEANTQVMAEMEARSNSQEMRSAQSAMKARAFSLASAAGSGAASGAGGDAKQWQPAAPMIARTVSLTLQVAQEAEARAALEAILARHQGYAADMTATTADNTARTLHASVRIPANELESALKELRTLGRVQSEQQTGEEVTQQHQDLEARLKNSRETEARLQGILQQRTGSLSDVLEVEEEIARVRGEIEGMEAEQAGLEHRVDFASVDITLSEGDRVGGTESLGARLSRSLHEGATNAGDTMVGMLVFAEEYGPSLLVWGVVLGIPGWWVWRRYRRARRAE